jgi:glycosyltransferase involved in cell wall biosynthesis
MSQEPFISIVIPTRNRAHLVRHAIQSVLWQGFDDYELIVSDNCSADGTVEAVREAAGERARYVRPDRVLSMPDHWEFALEQARGRFVTYLCDDDVWVPGALARVAEVLGSSRADLAVTYSGLYYAPNWLDPERQNLLYLPPYTGSVQEYGSDETIRRIYSECRVVYEAPRMLNTFCRREMLRRVRAAAGRVFLLCPDYSFAVMALTGTHSWLHLDEPLHLQGVFPEGIGSTQSFNRGEPSLEFAREFKEERLLRHVPLKSLLVSNMITETLLLSKERLPALAGYEVDWVNYFLSCRADIETLGGNGVDTTADREEFERVLAGQPAELRERVASGERNVVQPQPLGTGQRGAVRVAARRLINSSPLLAKLETLVRRPGGGAPPPPQLLLIPGREAGFDDILGCAQFLPELAGREKGTAAHG